MDWAQASLPHESTGLTPYEVEFGCAPQHPWDWRRRTERRTFSKLPKQEQETRQQAQDYAKARHDAVKLATEIAQQGLQRAQA